MLLIGSVLLGFGAGLSLQLLKIQAKWAWSVGAIVAVGVLCVGLSLRASLLP